MTKIALLIVLSLFLNVTSADAGQSHQTSSVQLKSHKLSSSVNWLLKDNNTGELRLNGLFAIDDKRLIAYGSIAVPAGDVRSVLLFSQDGGMSWKETMGAISASSVEAVTFNDNGLDGMAVVMWTLGGFGESRAFYTSDGGKTWEQKGRIPKQKDLNCQPMDISSKDKSTFILQVNCQSEDSNEEMNLLTIDSGKTWKRYNPPSPIKTYYDSVRDCYSSLKETSCWSVSNEDDLWRVIDKTHSKGKGVIYIQPRVHIKGSQYSIRR